MVILLYTTYCSHGDNYIILSIIMVKTRYILLNAVLDLHPHKLLAILLLLHNLPEQFIKGHITAIAAAMRLYPIVRVSLT